jgi:hypothetical protein
VAFFFESQQGTGDPYGRSFAILRGPLIIPPAVSSDDTGSITIPVKSLVHFGNVCEMKFEYGNEGEQQRTPGVRRLPGQKFFIENSKFQLSFPKKTFLKDKPHGMEDSIFSPFCKELELFPIEELQCTIGHFVCLCRFILALPSGCTRKLCEASPAFAEDS